MVKNICFHKSRNLWYFQKQIWNRSYQKYFKTFEEAVAYKEEFILIHKFNKCEDYRLCI